MPWEPILKDAANRIFEQACRTILDEAGSMIARINAKPVYTVHELWEGHRLQPRQILVLGGPAPWFAKGLERLSECRVTVVPRWEVANAIGAGLARTTCEVTFFADTERKIASAPEENWSAVIPSTYTKEDAVATTLDLLRRKAITRGADAEHLELEVVDAMSFNMVRGFNTTGRNIRVTAQVKPGLIHGYDPIAEKMFGQQFSLKTESLSCCAPKMDKTGLVFFPAFDWAISPTHPEREERLLYTQDQVFEEGILDIEGIVEYKPDLVTKKDVQRVHFCVPDVWAVMSESHFISAGGAKTIAMAVMDKQVERGFALVRPPGHHANRVVHGARGFCNVNIEAIMIEYIRQAYGVNRVAIVDTDCHHGDGTQDIYWHDPDTLFISIHQDGRTLYPGSGF
jgi:hypothetical protein